VTRPIIILGDELTFRIGASCREQPQARTTQIWAADHHQTRTDDTIFVPQFVYSLRCERNLLARPDLPSSFPLFQHGPTTDGMSCTAHLEQETVVLAFREITIRMQRGALVELFDRALAVLER